MLRLGSRARYQGHDCIVVGRTIKAHSRYDLLFPASLSRDNQGENGATIWMRKCRQRRAGVRA